MPISPEKKALYPPDWKAISLRVRTEADWTCEFCGAKAYEPHPVTGSKVVLTVAHLNHDTTDNRDTNLAALCNRCHLAWDLEHHMANAKRTRALKREQSRQAAGQQALF